jgi:hypothetical protein
MRFDFAFLVTALALSSITDAAADAPRLKGSYGFTGSAVCLVAPGYAGVPNGGPPLPNPTPGVALPNSGFQANLRPTDALSGITESYTYSFSVIGVRTFDGNGNGTVKGTAFSITGRPTPGPGGFPHFPPSAGTADFSFSVTYVVNNDGSWTSSMVPGSFTETHLTGPRAGETSTVDAIPTVTGMISQDGKTLIDSQLAPTVETHTYSNGDVDPQICNRSRVLIKLGDDDDRHDGDGPH